ncbi:MAG TPA: ATP-binding protein [Aestuariivirgaceae bacterium]|nr:ATP-binding protein [Aestuariivirgaceae bacterium]
MIWPWTRELQGPGTGQVVHLEREIHVLDAVAQALPDPFIVLDGEGVIAIANRAAEEVMETSLLGQPISIAVRSPQILEAVEGVATGGEAVHVDYERRVPVERRFQAFIAPIAIPAAESRTRRPILIVLRDLTREQQIERMRADFVANASHELRTPLASLLGFIETLLGSARNDATARDKFLPLMRTQAERMKRVIDDLLSLSRIELNAHRRPTETVDAGLVLRQVAELMAGMARDSDVALELDVAGRLDVVGDRDELIQVLQNLVENAIKYASNGRRVVLHGRHLDLDRVELAVEDFGPGIADEHIPRLTERFYRVSVQESRARGGTGLGLAIVKHILNRHRGKLQVSSRLGSGSTFRVVLPAAPHGLRITK